MTINRPKSRMYCGLLSAAMLLAHAPLVESAVQATDIPNRQIDHFSFGYQPLWVWEFVSLCQRAAAPCGMELVSKMALPAVKIEKAPDQASVATILDVVISEHPEYQWVLDDGVINVVPKDTLGNRLTRVLAGNPLDRKIKSLDVTGATLREAVSNVICPEAGLQCVTSAWSPSGPPDLSPDRKVSLHLKNVTVRQALNALVRKDGHSIWFLWKGSGRKTELYMHRY